jgi:hypothetical protein
VIHAGPAARGAEPSALAATAGGAAPRTTSVSDGAGGFYLIFTGGFGGSFFSVTATAGQSLPFWKTRVVHLGADGLPASGWPADGIAVTTTPDNHGGAVFTSDGAGGVIVAWDDYTGFDGTIRAQRIDPSGARLWGAGGMLMGAGSGYRYVESIAPDGAGGALVSWNDSGADPSDDQSDIYLQRVTSAGGISGGWPANGLAVCTATDQQFGSRVVPDGSGGAIVAWNDFRSVSSLDVFAQHVSGAGSPLWTADGISIATSGSSNSLFDFTTDGAGGLIVAFPRFDGATFGVFAQRFDTAGNEAWNPGGVLLSLPQNHLSNVSVTSDSAGGAIACWQDYRNNPSLPEIFAQHVTSSGDIAPGWASSGESVGDSAVDAYAPRIAADGTGGAFIEWEVEQFVPDYRVSIQAQRMIGTGVAATGWVAGGTVVTGFGSRPDMYGIQISSDGASGLVCAWNDVRDTGAGNGFYAQRLDSTSAKQWEADGAPAITFRAPAGAQSHPALVRRASGGVQVAWAQWEGGSASVELREIQSAGDAAGPAATLSGTPAYFVPPAIPDGLGGAFLCWTQFGAGGLEVRVQRIDGDGAELWTPGGVVVPDVTDPAGVLLLGMVADNSGGVMIARLDNASGGMLLQRLDAFGAAKWPGGVTIAGVGPFTGYASLIPDDNGGLIAISEANFQDFKTLRWYTNLVAQRVDSSGVALWGPTGVYLAPGARDEVFPRATRDGFGGALVCWMGDQIYVGTDVWTQRITSTGAVATGWPAAGVLTGGATGRQILPDIAPDLLGGAYVAWSDGRGPDVKVYAQHLDGSGAPQWAAYGLPVAASPGPQFLQMVEADNTAGFHLSWLDGASSSWNVYAQRMNSASTLQWGANGLGVCTEAGDQFGSILLSGNAGGAFVGWEDQRDPARSAIFVQKINPQAVMGWTPDGLTGTTASLESATAEPDRVRLTWWSDGSLPRATLERADAPGAWRVIATLTADGTGRLRYEDRDVAPGARYGYRLRAAGGADTFGEAWLDVPLAAAFALEGARPNPSAGPLAVSFSVPARGRATLDAIDVSGRRVLLREVAAEAGRNLVPLGGFSPPPGVYVLRLTFGGRTLASRFVRTR